jgi:hypothetical protein
VGNDDQKEKNKALGGKYLEVTIDEAQDHPTDLENLTMQVCFPAVADLRGSVVMSGTPSDNVFGFFFRVATGQVPGWSIHKWLAADNPYTAKEIADQIEFLRSTNPKVDSLPWFRQMYLNEWVVDAERLVYRASEANYIQQLPERTGYPWHHVLGIDLGWEDATAFVLLAYRDYDRCTYVVRAHRQEKMLLSDVEAVIRRYQTTVPNLDHIVVDNASKQAVEEINSRLGIRMIPAEKAGKADFIQIVNSEFKSGYLKIVTPDCEQLYSELSTLTWDARQKEKGLYVEDGKCQNHCADGMLYAYRLCYSWLDRGAMPQEQSIEERMEAELEAEILKQSQGEWWEQVS